MLERSRMRKGESKSPDAHGRSVAFTRNHQLACLQRVRRQTLRRAKLNLTCGSAGAEYAHEANRLQPVRLGNTGPGDP